MFLHQMQAKRLCMAPAYTFSNEHVLNIKKLLCTRIIAILGGFGARMVCLVQDCCNLL